MDDTTFRTIKTKVKVDRSLNPKAGAMGFILRDEKRSLLLETWCSTRRCKNSQPARRNTKKPIRINPCGCLLRTGSEERKVLSC